MIYESWPQNGMTVISIFGKFFSLEVHFPLFLIVHVRIFARLNFKCILLVFIKYARILGRDECSALLVLTVPSLLELVGSQIPSTDT